MSCSLYIFGSTSRVFVRNQEQLLLISKHKTAVVKDRKLSSEAQNPVARSADAKSHI